MTEIGPPEPVDRALHPLATAIGIAALVAVVIVGLVALSGVSGDGDQGGQVAEIVVPRVSGRPLVEAQAQLEELGLIVDVSYEPNETTPPDVVVDQDPIAGARLEVGEQVVLGVSDGPAGVRVPDFGNVSGAEAVRLLGALGLSGIVEEVYDEEAPAGRIIGSVPATGARAVVGESVRVLVSKGPEPRTVPEVVGEPSVEAFAALGRAELQIGKVLRRATPGAEPGTIVSTTPPGGTQAPKGYPVAVVIAALPGAQDVPDLVGFTQASASRLAADLGLQVSVRTEVLGPGDRRVGRVISQSPVAYSPVATGATMTLTVGVVPAPPTTTTTTAVPGLSPATTEPPR